MSHTRLDYHLTHHDDKLMIQKTQNIYNSMSIERKNKATQLIISTQDTCSGRMRLVGHRLWIELLVLTFLYENNDYEIDDFSKEEIEDVCIYWFFEIWCKSEYYKLDDYVG